MKDKNKKIKAELTEDAERILSYNKGIIGHFENSIRLLGYIKERELPRRGYFYIAGYHLDGLLGNIKQAETSLDTLKHLIEDYRKKEKIDFV